MRTLVCLLVVLIVCLSGVAANAAPDLQAGQLIYDFGEIFQGDRVLHTFEFNNNGDEDLVIDRVKSSCGCTAALVSEKIIPPGGKGEIKANFDSSRFRNSVSKTIYLYSNDLVYPVLQFHIKGTILEKIALEPAQLNFGQVAAEELVQGTIVLRNQAPESLVLGKATTTAAELVATVPQGPLASGDEITMSLKLTPKPGISRFSGYVLIPVNGVPKNQLRIPVYATIQ